MKVCILSMQDVQNFGSLLQALSLKEMLTSLGAEVSFLPIRPDGEDDRLLHVHDDFSDEYEAPPTLLGRLSKVDRYLVTRLKDKAAWRKEQGYMNAFRLEHLPRAREGGHFDLCVIGSD